MGSENHPVRQSGIYHNLPQFDPDIKGLTAIVTGANGISGFHTCRALLDSPQRWSKIYAMSRRPPPEGMMNLLTPEQRGKIEHVASDFLKKPEELAEAMKKAGIGKVDCELLLITSLASFPTLASERLRRDLIRRSSHRS